MANYLVNFLKKFFIFNTFLFLDVFIKYIKLLININLNKLFIL